MESLTHNHGHVDVNISSPEIRKYKVPEPAPEPEPLGTTAPVPGDAPEPEPEPRDTPEPEPTPGDTPEPTPDGAPKPEPRGTPESAPGSAPEPAPYATIDHEREQYIRVTTTEEEDMTDESFLKSQGSENREDPRMIFVKSDPDDIPDISDIICDMVPRVVPCMEARSPVNLSPDSIAAHNMSPGIKSSPEHAAPPKMVVSDMTSTIAPKFHQEDEASRDLFPGVPCAIPLHQTQISPNAPVEIPSRSMKQSRLTVEQIPKVGPQTLADLHGEDSQNLNNSRMEDSSGESEDERASPPRVPPLKLEVLGSYETDSSGPSSASARSDSSATGVQRPKPQLQNPYFYSLGMPVLNQYAVREGESSSTVVRPTAQLPPHMPPFSSTSPFYFYPACPFYFHPNIHGMLAPRKSTPRPRKTPQRKRPAQPRASPRPPKQPRSADDAPRKHHCNTCREEFSTRLQLSCHLANIHLRQADHACVNCAAYSSAKLRLLHFNTRKDMSR